MKGDVFIDKNGKMWIEIDLDDGNVLEDTCDISSEYGFPDMCILDSSDSEYIDIEYENEMNKIATNYKMRNIVEGFGRWVYIDEKKVKSFLIDKLQKCKNLKDYNNFFVKYGVVLYSVTKDN